MAPKSPAAWKELDPGQWLAFHGVNGLKVAGPGTINGRGQGWWDQSCRYHPKLVHKLQFRKQKKETASSGICLLN